jgi:hypothetical protein
MKRKPFDDFTAGMVVAAAHLMNGHGEEMYAREILGMAGITQEDFKRMEPFDRKALLPCKARLPKKAHKEPHE